MGDEKVQIAFYGTRELRRKLKKEALERGTSVQDLIEQAIVRDFSLPKKQELEFTVANSTVPIGTLGEGQRELGLEAIHKLVDFVYASGVESLTTALSFTLEGFAAGAQLHVQKNETTGSAVSREEERTEALLRKAREVTESARRSLEGESGTGSGNDGGENADHPASAWRRRA
jgi:hypothetical protein